ncbi:MAG: long-chain-fatty-acid--CoA ligase [Thermodesulfobacteriota bacterium]
MNVKHLIGRAARQFPERTALVDKDKRLTFEELNRRANCLANGLLDLGVTKADHVGILLSNCYQFIECDFALSKTGIVRVPLNASLSARDHKYTLNDSKCKALIFGEKFTEDVEMMRNELETVEKFVCVSNEIPMSLDAIGYEDIIGNSSPEEPATRIERQDLHTLFYTSGTTGKPKGAMLTQEAWASVAMNLLLDYGPITQEDVLLNVQPLSHGAGFFVLPFFIRGAAQVLVEFKTSLVFQTIEREKVTVFKLVPVMLKRLLEDPDKTRYDLTSLKHIIYGGSPIGRPLLEDSLRFFGRILSQLYGQGEIPMAITVLSREDHILEGTEEEARRLNSAGKACTNVEVKIVDEKGAEVRPGVVGEIVARGYHCMSGYWGLTGATAETLKDGWIHTGDLGYMDSKGFVFLVDRKKEVIISGAFNIYPAEVEQVLVTHPSIAEVAVIGVPDDNWGESVKAIVVLKKNHQSPEKDIIDFCKENGLKFKTPKSVEFVDELPRSHYGKVDKKILREPYWAGLKRNIH